MPDLRDCKIRYHYGVYEIRYRKNGFDKSFSHKTISGAKNKARAFLSTLDNSSVTQKTLIKRSDVKSSVNAAAFCENWLKNVKSRTIKNVTFISLMKKYEKHIKPTLKKYYLKTLSAPVIQNIFDSVTTKVAEDIRTIFNGMFEYAIASGLVDKSPMPVIIIKKHERQKGSRLTKEQEQNLLKLIKGTKYETSIKLYLYTGARPSELKTIYFDWDEGTFTLHNSKLKSYQKEQTRTIPIFPTLYAMKNEIRKSKIFNETLIGSYFRKYFHGYQIKTLRHTFTSKCKEQGVMPELVNYWTGHTIGSDTSAKVYTHFDIDFQKEEAKKITW